MMQEERTTPDSEGRGDGEPDAGAFIGQQPEWAADSIKDGPQPGEERVAGEATMSLGPAQMAANPDPGWKSPPEGHRHLGVNAGDEVREAGSSTAGEGL
jgi:hypothetical protein